MKTKPCQLNNVMIENTSIEWTTISLTTNYQNKEQTIDLMPSFREIIIRESLNNKVLTGTIEFTDVNAIFNADVFYTGKNILKLKFKDIVSEDNVEYAFLITGIDDIKKDLNSQLLTLSFTEEAALLLTQEFAGYLDKQTASDFIKSFSKDTLSKSIDKLEDTSGKLSLAIPFLKFAHVLTYLNFYSKSTNGYCGYTYFTNSLKKVYYCTYSYLFKQDKELEFLQVPYAKAELDYTYFGAHTVKDNGNLLIMANACAVGGINQTFDFDKKEPKMTEYTYSDLVKKSKITNGKYSLYPNTIDNKKSKYYYSEDANTYKFEINHVLRTIESATAVSFGTYGVYGRGCGMVAKITFESMNDPQKSSDTERSGNYLIYSVVHHMFPSAYRQEFQAIRTSINTQNTNLVSV